MSTTSVTRAGPVAEAEGKPRFRRDAAAVLVLLIALLATPILIGDSFIYHVFITILLYGALATAWNIVGGFAGQLSLGHAIFYGIGAYTAVILMDYGVSPWFGMIAGAALAALVAVGISWPCFRLRGPFFALATVALLEVFRLLSLHFRDLTGGATGKMVPLQIGWEWMIFRERWPSLLIAFGLLVLALAVAGWLRGHRLGYQLIATREREAAAMALGIETVRLRLLAVALSAGLAATVGTFHAMYLTFIEPEAVFSLTLSIQIAMFALIGGLGTVIGPLLGTLLVVPVTELARGWLGAEAIGLHGFVYGTVLVLAVLFMPNGIIGLFKGRFGGAAAAKAPDGSPRLEAIHAPASAPAAPAIERSFGPPILRAENLGKSFGGLKVIDGVSFDLREGEVLGVIGPNGAGKTTIFNMLSGVLRPDAGGVAVRPEGGGDLIRPASPPAFAHAGVGRTFQIVQPFAGMTVLENVMIGAFRRHPSVAAARGHALEVVDAMGLYPQRHAEARHLTIGGLKRLEVARVMAMEPRVLLLDEVMAGLNQADVKHAIDLMKTIRDRGVSIIAIEHVMQAIMSLSDRVIVINSGRIIASGAPEAVVQDKAVIEAYLGEEFTHAPA